jgi:Ca2+-binding RTX toxin-like protein
MAALVAICAYVSVTHSVVAQSSEDEECAFGGSVIRGTEDDDELVGTEGPDKIWGAGGNDTIEGLGGDDVICSGSGDDRIDGGEGDDALLGQSGKDRIDGGPGDEAFNPSTSVVPGTVNGGSGNDTLTGGPGTDDVLGELGDDTLDSGPDGDCDVHGGDGADTIETGDGSDGRDFAGQICGVSGGQGNDTIELGDGDDNADAGPGADEVSGAGGSDLIDGGEGADILTGGDGDDFDQPPALQAHVDGGPGPDRVDGGGGRDGLFGGEGNDHIAAGDGDDCQILGGGGNDTITGGAGNEQLDASCLGILGEEGNDRIDLGSGDDRADAGGGNDTVVGGAGADTLEMGHGIDHCDGGAGTDSCDGGAPGRPRPSKRDPDICSRKTETKVNCRAEERPRNWTANYIVTFKGTVSVDWYFDNDCVAGPGSHQFSFSDRRYWGVRYIHRGAGLSGSRGYNFLAPGRMLHQVYTRATLTPFDGTAGPCQPPTPSDCSPLKAKALFALNVFHMRSLTVKHSWEGGDPQDKFDRCTIWYNDDFEIEDIVLPPPDQFFKRKSYTLNLSEVSDLQGGATGTVVEDATITFTRRGRVYR